MKPLTFKVPLFGGRVKVFFSLDDFQKADPYAKPDRDFGFYDAFFWNRPIGYCIVFVKYSDNTLAHEAVHCAWAILADAGVEVTQDNDEPLAYMVDRIVERVQKHRAKEIKNGENT